MWSCCRVRRAFGNFVSNRRAGVDSTKHPIRSEENVADAVAQLPLCRGKQIVGALAVPVHEVDTEAVRAGSRVRREHAADLRKRDGCRMIEMTRRLELSGDHRREDLAPELARWVEVGED